MAIQLGSDAITALYLGADPISKVYLGADLILDTGGGGGGAPTAQFDGNSYLVNPLFGGADSSLFSFAYVVKFNSNLNQTPFFIEDVPNNVANNIGITLNRDTTQITVEDDVVIADGSNFYYGGPGLGFHIYIGTVSTNHAAGAKKSVLYVDRLKVPISHKLDNSDPFTMPLHNIPLGIGGLPNNGGSGLIGDLAYIWLAAGVSLLDGSDNIPAATLDKFITADGALVDLGADGSLPTGSAPSNYHKGGGSSFATNLGTSGDVSLNGALTDGDTVSTITPWVAPVITSGASASVAENQTAAITVTATVMSGKTAVYSIDDNVNDDGGNGAFVINSATGVLTFASAPDFENPTDLNTDNVYEVTVRASDGLIFLSQAISITVTNVAD